MIDADLSWIIRVYHNHLRSIIFVVYFLRVTLVVAGIMSGHGPLLPAVTLRRGNGVALSAPATIPATYF